MNPPTEAQLKTPFRLNDHPELKKDFFDVPKGFADDFAYRMQLRIAQERKRSLPDWGSIVRRLLAPSLATVATVVLVAVLSVNPRTTEGSVSEKELAEISYEAALEEALLDPVLAEQYLASLTTESQEAQKLQAEMKLLPVEAVVNYVETEVDENLVLELLDSQP